MEEIPPFRGRRQSLTAGGMYPLPAQLAFCPGGVTYGTAKKVTIALADKANVVHAAKQADERLRQYSLLSGGKDSPHFLPSLSVLAEAVFGRLTGCPPDQAKAWADAMVLSQYSELTESIPQSEDDILNAKPAAVETVPETTAPALLKRLLQQQQDAHSAAGRPQGPCGYLFKRGDIAWNCRTCQADTTCVICDDCFRGSNHEGHEVYFHRTTPGGCCDCGDAEAWNIDGCCDAHRPLQEKSAETKTLDILDDPMEAVRMAANARQASVDTLTTDPATKLPPRLLAALGVVIGAAVQALVEAVDGSGVGTDAVQWRKRWSDEAARVANGAPHNEDYALLNPTGSLATIETYYSANKSLPDNYKLQLRLHNDDVHTFEEVIDALHERHRRSVNNSEEMQHPSLVSLRENATEMTHRVDADGQVTVKTYSNVAAAMRGFRRLKANGLHCAVVSSVQVDAEHRARALCTWLSELAAVHPAAQAILVHAFVQVFGRSDETDGDLAGIHVWSTARMLPPWIAVAHQGVNEAGQTQAYDEITACRLRFQAFPPHLASSYLTREESELLHGIALASFSGPTDNRFVEATGTVPTFYSTVPYRLPSFRYHKSPHALWGTLPSHFSDPVAAQSKHPLLERLAIGNINPATKNRLTESVYVVDTDLRKQQEGERITVSVFPHKLPGLNMISGIGTTKVAELDARRPPLPSPMDLRHLLATSSFRAPVSPILLLLLLDPYPTKQLRVTLHALFLSLLTNARFKSRFAGALSVAYRPLSTLFCAGVGTEADTPLQFTVQLFTAGSLVRALGHGPAIEKLLLSDQETSSDLLDTKSPETSIGVFVPPIAHIIVRCIHTNLLGATKEVTMILKNTESMNDENSQDDGNGNSAIFHHLTYVAGEHPLTTPLPATPDDFFLESRSSRHKRLPHLLRDLDYVVETPGTAMRLLLPKTFPVYQSRSLPFREEDLLTFPAVFSRMLRLAQGMDPLKRVISGGHVEYEQNRWLEAFGLSLNFGGTRDALAESPCASMSNASKSDGSHLVPIREAIGNIISSLLREIKFWLYREGMLETGLPIPSGSGNGAMDLAQIETLQRSTLHVSSSQLIEESSSSPTQAADIVPASSSVALSCATGVKMTEAQLTLIENALRIEAVQRAEQQSLGHGESPPRQSRSTGPVIEDWLRVPHSPLAGDSLSFHLPVHRALAKFIRNICSVVVPDSYIAANPNNWWKLPILDDSQDSASPDPTSSGLNHPLVSVIKTTLRSSNCRVVWSSGPDCSPQEAQRRRLKSRTVSANIAVAKIIHSLADHPIRCLAASQQIQQHLWPRNGDSMKVMALNYSSAPLCRSFRDLDYLLVQLSAAGMSCGLGARRVFALLLSRFSMDGYLCDPERRAQTGTSGAGSFGSSIWVNPPRLQDPDHAVVLAEAFFSTCCVLVTELPSPPPSTSSDDSGLRRNIRRELLHALAAEPRSHSEAKTAASIGVSRREDSEGASGKGGGLFRDAFAGVLREIGRQKNQSSSRAASGPPAFELKADVCDEYDPTFFHLRREEHQHAMDVVSRLRKQKWGDKKEALETHCLPLVCAPPKAHPRFLSCRLVLHLEAMDAALRRALLFALTNGSWLPPSEPESKSGPEPEGGASLPDTDVVGVSTTVTSISGSGSVDVPVTTFNRRQYRSQNSSATFPKRANDPTPFSTRVVAASSVSFLEVLQLLTLQVHTLEECASLHRTLPDLDDESRSLSSGLSINSYLGRLIRVPDSLVGAWALLPYPEGPLPSKGSGQNRGSILGLLIALYEHRSDHGSIMDADGGDFGQNDDGHGGARTLAASGLKWLLRFVHALVAGAPSVAVANKSATTGVPVKPAHSFPQNGNDSGSGAWTINENVRSTISGMLRDLPDLWPKPREQSESPEKGNAKSKEAGKAAQLRAMELMKRKQAAFAATVGPSDALSGQSNETEQETDLCIICRCDDADGENNGPLGYLGHVQRSRMVQMRATKEGQDKNELQPSLANSYRVVGHMGCQLRESEAMDSKPLTCLPKGSVVFVLQSKVSSQYDILSRRVLVRHVSQDPITKVETVTEGWASVQSSQGYVILSPLVSLCYANSRWGSTRPIIKQCGHAAHLKCVETHTLSLHQRAAGEQPYDGRFAANIADGEFLCPLCKQLSNILIPRDSPSSASAESSKMDVEDSTKESAHSCTNLRKRLSSTRSSLDSLSVIGRRALEDFGSHLHTAMSVSWERTAGSRKRQDMWYPAIQKWDFEEEEDDDEPEAMSSDSVYIKNILRLFRQQLISWAAVGHSAAALEAGARGVQEVLPFGIMSGTSDPWPEFNLQCRDTHPMLLELKRTLSASSGLLDVLFLEMGRDLAGREMKAKESTLIGTCLADILEGVSWIQNVSPDKMNAPERVIALWSELTALVSAIPSHVARDGTIPQRCEARANAAAMWAVKGIPCDGKQKTEPPAPLAIQRLFDSETKCHPPIPPSWGTMVPFVSDESEMPRAPFRPAIACAFLCTPLLAWDMNTLSGALLSCILSNADSDLPTENELMHIGHSLMIGRMVQSIITPGGFDLRDEVNLDEEDCWSEQEAKIEGSALVKLFSHCRTMTKNKALTLPMEVVGDDTDISSSALLAGVGRALLPFSRALVLMLRACTAVIRERQQKRGTSVQSSDSKLRAVLYDGEIMVAEDGFLIARAMQCPKPSDLIDCSGAWFSLINRWLVAVTCFEIHHGSVGRSIMRPVVPPTDNVDRPVDQPPGDTSMEDTAMDVDETVERGVDRVISVRRSENFIISDDLDGGMVDSDEELADSMDEAEEMVSFPETFGGPTFGASPTASGNVDPAESSDNSSSGTEEGNHETDRTFANVSRSSILPYQASVLGIEGIGPGRRSMFEYSMANKFMADLSHLGLVHQKEAPTFSLIRLPKSFVELYNLVNKVKGRDDATVMDDSDDASSSETSICLLTGAVMRSGSARRVFSRTARSPGACTLHARKTASGIGIFFLVQKCTVLLMHNNKSAYSPSLYVDEHGEEDPQLRRGRPLFLNEARYRALENLWRQQGIPREVAQIRSTSDRVIRDNWY